MINLFFIKNIDVHFDDRLIIKFKEYLYLFPNSIYKGQLLFRSSVSVSKSSTISAGLSGISTASAGAYSNGNNAKTESHSLSLGQATATSFGTIENGQAITGAASSAGTSQSSTTGGNRRQFSQAGAVNARNPCWPTWSNVDPSNAYNGEYNYQLYFYLVIA